MCVLGGWETQKREAQVGGHCPDVWGRGWKVGRGAVDVARSMRPRFGASSSCWRLLARVQGSIGLAELLGEPAKNRSPPRHADTPTWITIEYEVCVLLS